MRSLPQLILCLLLSLVSPALYADDMALLPKAHLVGSTVRPAHLIAPSISAGGVAGTYKDTKGAYQQMLVRLPTTEKAAFLLLDVKKLMTAPRYLPHIGGFFGQKEGKPFYVFAKGPFLAVIEGKPEPEAEVLARIFAARLPLR